MKRIVGLMLAALLIIPAASYAGSATSRWDLTIGGKVKMDLGWTDSKGSGAANAQGYPSRDSKSGYKNVTNNEYGNWFWGAGETGLNFGVRGPDAWGAKTRAYVSGDFMGTWGGSAYNSFDLMAAYLAFDWTNTSLLIGQSGSVFGAYGTFAYDPAFGNLGFGGKGTPPVTPQITLTQNFAKNWSASFSVMSQQAPTVATNTTNPLLVTGGAAAVGANSYTRGDIPLLVGTFNYTSNACGKVGPWQLMAGVSGVYGKQKQTFNSDANTVSDKNVDEWYTEFRFLVPIIPEKNGNKKNALYADGDIWVGQNLGGGFQGGWGSNVASYERSRGNYGANTGYGFVAHAAYYLTDSLFFNGFYWYVKQNHSDAFAIKYPDSMNSAYHYTANLNYDVNPAIKLVAQWDYTKANYMGASSTAGLKNYGTRTVYRIAAYYYF